MSLKKKIVLVFLFATLVPVVIGTIFVSKKTTTQVLKSREKVIDLADHDVKGLIKTVTDDVGIMLGVLSDIYLNKDDYLLEHGTKPNDESRRNHLIHHMSNFSSMNINTSEFILGIPGELPIYNVKYRTEAFRAGLPSDYNVVERPWYKGAIETDDVYISRPFIHARTKNL